MTKRINWDEVSRRQQAERHGTSYAYDELPPVGSWADQQRIAARKKKPKKKVPAVGVKSKTLLMQKAGPRPLATARAVITKVSPKNAKTTAASLRLEEPFTRTSTKNGSCTWCKKTAPRKMVQTNQGLLALCPECIHKAGSNAEQMRCLSDKTNEAASTGKVQARATPRKPKLSRDERLHNLRETLQKLITIPNKTRWCSNGHEYQRRLLVLISNTHKSLIKLEPSASSESASHEAIRLLAEHSALVRCAK